MPEDVIRPPGPAGRQQTPPVGSAEWFLAVRRRLAPWFRRHARQLPWRGTRDPYRVWVSEIMLQQTQAVTVAGYFGRFLDAFPTVAALAAADESDVLRLWEGLGYYRRARQMHLAARAIKCDHAGEFPRDAAAVRGLPGIGRYTAGAILSIAFDAPEPILEANTWRLWQRLLARGTRPLQAAGERQLWQAAQHVLPRRGAGQLNQALMELGSQVCTPRAPACPACPLESLCPTRKHGWQARLPRPKQRPTTVAVRETAVVVRKGPAMLLARRAEGGRWAGLWDFPRCELSAAFTPGDREPPDLLEGLKRATGIVARWRSHVATLKHSVTRYRVTLECHEVEYVRGRPRGSDFSDFRWVRPADLAALPLSAPGRRLAKILAS